MKRSGLILSALASGLLAAGTAGAGEPRWEWTAEAGRSLSLSGSNGLVWRLNFARDLAKFYFDPLRTPAGHDLSWVAPPDHPWHFGLWFSWKTINGINYWEMSKGARYPVGRTLIESVDVIETSQQQACVRIALTLRPAEGAEPVARETVWLRIDTPRADGAYAIDWRQRTEAVTDLEFGRTTGYGGLSFRGDRAWTAPRFLNSEGAEGYEACHLKPARWLDLSGTREAAQLGLTMLDHPSNPRHPTQWFLVDKLLGTGADRWPFHYSNAALLGSEPLRVAAGRRLDLCYRVLVHPGAGERGRLDDEFRAFAQLKPEAVVSDLQRTR